MRALKIAGWMVGGVIGLLLIGIVAITLFFDPNDYKPQIEQLVKDQTGREFKLEGELKLSFFPWLAVQTGAASLGNAAGYGDTPMVSINGARLGVKLRPLFSGRFEIGAVELDTPRIVLIETADGNNWSDIGNQTPDEAPANQETADAGTLNASIASLSIQNGSISYEDRAAGTVSTLGNFNLSTGKLEPGQPFEVQTAFDLLRHDTASADVADDTNLSADLKAQVTADTDNGQYTLSQPALSLLIKDANNPKDMPVTLAATRITASTQTSDYQIEQPVISTTLTGESYPKEGLPVTIKADTLSANTESQMAQIKALLIEAAGASITGELQATQIIDKPAVTGTLKLAQVSPRQLLPKLGIDVPNTADAKTLQRLSMEAGLTATDNSVELKPLKLQLDDTHITGSAGIADLEATALRFDLLVDQINLDRYLEPEAPEQATTAAAAEPTAIPADAVRDLNLRGKLAAKSLTVSKLPISNFSVSVEALDNKLQLSALQATLYEGKLRGNIGLDASGKTPRVSIEQTMDGINFAPLFANLFDTKRISGRGNASMKLTGSGADTAALKRALNGTLTFTAKDGALEGFDLWYEIRRARAVLKQQTIPTRTGTARTAFTSLNGSATVTDGVVNNQDLVAALQYLTVKGNGTFNLGNDALDYKLNATVLKIPAEDKLAEQTQDLSGLTIPVRITGTLADPKVRPDVQGLLKEKAKQRIEEEKEKVIEKAKDKLQNKLKGLFGGG